ncbi:insulinase family protein [Sinirhodobacter populi]|uniref:Insulinase family protein n=1 Tax=Paenirhodobacter populi TaxID=2306993 RepID=A0A443K2K7_9RHOB|nr:pitrilysin family protein [Sinirhodobacter populi]RWR26998.1 insulinase family protein [Sinirhodobacter populi]
MLRASLAAVFAVFAIGSAHADPVSHFTLPNGLETVVIEDHRAPVVVQMVWYKTGSADEQRGKSGIAHFLEHLMFKGTDTMAAGELSKTVSANGGSDNAFTSYDYTAYFQRIAADRLELVMKMEADRMRNLKISPDDWKTEREVILEERSQRTDSDPGALYGEQARAAQYLNSPYGTPVIGWRQEMEGLTRDDALAWYNRFYAPNNAVLVVAGDVTPDEVKTLAEKYYGPLEPSADIPPRLRPQEPPQLAARRLDFRDDRVAQPYLSRTYLAPERNPGDQKQAAALTVLSAILGGNAQTSVLSRKLVFDRGDAIYVSTSYDGMSIDKTSFAISLMPAPDVSLPDAEKALDAALAEFLKEGIDTAQFERIRAQIRAGQIYQQDNTQGLARRYGEALASGFSIKDVQDWPEILMSVTEDDVMAAAKSLLNPAASVTGYITKPDRSDPAAPPSAVPASAGQEVVQ